MIKLVNRYEFNDTKEITKQFKIDKCKLCIYTIDCKLKNLLKNKKCCRFYKKSSTLF